jgi:hypothetical protein
MGIFSMLMCSFAGRICFLTEYKRALGHVTANASMISIFGSLKKLRGLYLPL